MAKLKLKAPKGANIQEEVNKTSKPPSDTPQSRKVSIRDVVDRSQPFTMLFSGAEEDRNFNLLYEAGVRSFLVSYQYVMRKHMKMDQYHGRDVKFFVDSGAFTYMGDEKYQAYTLEEWEKHIESYLRWVRKHRSVIFAIASLDIEMLVGGEQVQKWNEKYFEPFMLETGIPVCFVWHEEATILTWEQYCQRYPYLGVSWSTEETDLNKGMNYLRIAEKYNTVVHGMALTKVPILTKLPFYTVDSTTWLIGLKYGEVNFWDGKKLLRLVKDRWKGDMLDRIVAKGFDRDKLLEEEVHEMMLVNVHAFIEAQEYIRTKLKSREYWLRPDSTTRTQSDVDNIEYPSAQWIDDPDAKEADWKEWAKSFNISTEDKDMAINCIVDLTCFMNWYNDDYQEFIQDVYKPDVIKQIHDQWVNSVVQSEEERIEDLIEFFTSVLKGESDKLLVLGTNFDRTIRERDDYISDEEYELKDVSNMEIMNKVSRYLPEKTGETAPEIDELDDEIFAQENIIPVRDSKGRFLKGQKQVLKPKNLYSDKFPKLACDTCFAAQKCEHYKAGCACAYSKMFTRFDTRDMGDIIQAMQGIANFSLTRVQKAMLFEMLEGGLPDPALTGLMDQSMKYMAQLKTMYENGGSTVLKQTKTVRSDGSQETVTQLNNPQGSGIIQQIFGDLGKKDSKEDVEDIVDVDLSEGIDDPVEE